MRQKLVPWTVEEKNILIKNYPDNGKLFCCKLLNRSEASVRWEASFLKLKINRNSQFYKDFQKRAALGKVGKRRPEHSAWMKKYSSLIGRVQTEKERFNSSERTKKWIKKNGHPRGALGKHWKLSEEQRKHMRDSFTEERRQEISNRSLKMIKENKHYMFGRKHSSWKSGHYDINGVDYFFRSLWEANYALYLDWLKKTKNIKDWGYEKQIFIFEEIKRGTRSYKPDFQIINNDGTIEYHEVKGWMDAASKTKIDRMKKYYPEIKLILIQKDEYNSLKKNSRLFGWIDKLPEQNEKK